MGFLWLLPSAQVWALLSLHPASSAHTEVVLRLSDTGTPPGQDFFPHGAQTEMVEAEKG